MTSSNSARYRLLAVDDDRDSAELIVRNALRCGYECFPVYDARTLREMISHWRPHVVTLDLCLPDGEAHDTISALKAARFAGDLIIISGQPDDIRKAAVLLAIESGLKVTGDLPKPIQIVELRELLSAIKAGLFATMLDQLSSKAQA